MSNNMETTPGQWYYKNGEVRSEPFGSLVATVRHPTDGVLIAKALRMQEALVEVAQKIEDAGWHRSEVALLRGLIDETYER